MNKCDGCHAFSMNVIKLTRFLINESYEGMTIFWCFILFRSGIYAVKCKFMHYLVMTTLSALYLPAPQYVASHSVVYTSICICIVYAWILMEHTWNWTFSCSYYHLLSLLSLMKVLVLSCSQDPQVVTGSHDSTIKFWDLRYGDL